MAAVFPEPSGRAGGERRRGAEQSVVGAHARRAAADRRTGGGTDRRLWRQRAQRARKDRTARPGERLRGLARGLLSRDAGQPQGADADPRLPRHGPSRRRSRSARHHRAQDPSGSCAPRPTASPRPISTAQFSSTRCSVSRPRRCARSCVLSAAPTAATSASSSCTSPARRRSRGCRSASRAQDKEITLHARRQARHPQQADRGRVLREILPTSSTPAPSASGSTVARRWSQRWSRSSSAAASSA